MNNSNHPLLHWIPNKLIVSDNTIFVEWVYLGGERFEDPFFEETIQKCKKHPYNSSFYKSVSSLENLIEWSSQIISVELKALIFHVSRCGSTMLSQSLASSAGNVIISEVPIIDEILRSDTINVLKKNALLQAVIRLLGQKRFIYENSLVIKLDAWHIFNAVQFRAIFPLIPFILLYRNPAEVLESHSKLRGMHMVPHLLPPHTYGLQENQIKSVSLQQYGALVLEKYFEAFLDFYSVDLGSTIYNYKQGMQNILFHFLATIDLNYSLEGIENMNNRLKTHSKKATIVFSGDSKIDHPLDIDMLKVIQLYNKLEDLRNKTKMKTKNQAFTK